MNEGLGNLIIWLIFFGIPAGLIAWALFRKPKNTCAMCGGKHKYHIIICSKCLKKESEK